MFFVFHLRCRSASIPRLAEPRRSAQQCIASRGHPYGPPVARHETQQAALGILQRKLFQAVLNNLQRRSVPSRP
eukprot:333356-Pyramimonas_sp.AAC.1